MQVTISDIKETSKAASAKAVIRTIIATLNAPTRKGQENEVILRYESQKFYFYLMDKLNTHTDKRSKALKQGIRVTHPISANLVIFRNPLETKDAS